jgi:hypothetical protein
MCYICLFLSKNKLHDMEKLRIVIGKQLNGLTFRIHPIDKIVVKKLFPLAQLPEGIFVEYDIRSNFERYHPQLEKYIFPALLGLEQDMDLKIFQSVHFINPHTKETLFKIEVNDSQIQSLSR